MIYFDNAATSFPKPETVLNKLDDINRNLAVNAGRGSYSLAHQANEIINETRQRLSKLAGTSPDRVVLYPSNTFAMNGIINGLKWDKQKTVYVSPFEHNAVMRPLALKEKKYGCQIKILPFDKDGKFNVDEAIRLFSQDAPDYIFVNHASNVTGTILPIEEISTTAKQYKPLIILDIAQTFGAIDVKHDSQFVDFLVFAGHKSLMGPLGVGGFINLKNHKLGVAFAGGTGSDSLNLNMPENTFQRYEIGSPNIAATAGLNEGLKWLDNIGIDNLAQHKEVLIKTLVDSLKADHKVHFCLNNVNNYRLGVISFVVDGYESEDVGSILNDEYDIAVRTGYHCAPMIHSLIGSKDYGGTIRVSVGHFNTIEDINKLVLAIRSL